MYTKTTTGTTIEGEGMQKNGGGDRKDWFQGEERRNMNDSKQK